MLRRTTSYILIVALLGGVAASCGDDDAEQSGGGEIPDGPIVIGGAWALTGVLSFADIPFSKGAELAVRDINAQGGVLGHKLELIKKDTKSQIPQVGNVASEVLGDGADFLLHTMDYDFGSPAARMASSKGIVSVSLAGDTRLGRAGIGEYAFNNGGGSETEAAVLADWAINQKKWKNFYVLADTTLSHAKTVCAAFEESVKHYGANVVGTDEFESTAQSISNQISRLRDALPETDAIMLCTFPPPGVAAIRQIRGAGIDAPILLDQAFDNEYTWLDAVPTDAPTFQNSYGLLDPTQNENPEQVEMVKRYEKHFGEPPVGGLPTFAGYAAVQLIAKGIERAESIDGDAVKEALETFKDEPTVLAPITWTPDCHVSLGQTQQVAEVVNKEQRFVASVEPSFVPEAVC